MKEDIGTALPSSASMKRLACMLMTDKPPVGQSVNMRSTSKGFLGWVLRTEEGLARKMHPEFLSAPHIRGAQAAADYLVNAFLAASQRGSFTLAVPNRSLNNFEKWMAMRSPRRGGAPLSICTLTQLLGCGPETSSPEPDIWVDLRGDSQLSVRLRNHTWSSVIPVMSVQHGLSKHTMLYDRYLRLLLAPHYPCDSLVCTSTASQRALTKIMKSIADSFNGQYGTHLRFNARIDLIPLCVDTDYLRPRVKKDLKKQLGIPINTILLLYIGYLSQAKADLTPLLSTMLKLTGANPDIDVRLAIAGTGPQEYCTELMNVAQDLGIVSKLIMMREVTDTQKELLFGAADIFVGPCQSMEESFGLTPIEAMACGLPQVVADWDGYRDTVVHGDTGFLIPTIWGRCEEDFCFAGDVLGWSFDHMMQGQSIAMDVGRMYECLQALIRQPELRITMSERSRARAVARFSYANVARLYDELWVELATIAATLQRSSEVRRFDEPTYFDYFGHYATCELSDEFIIDLSESDAITLETLTKVAHSELPGITIIDRSLLMFLCKRLTTAASFSRRMCVKELISQASHNEWSKEAIRRHILFLLKHGKVTVTALSNPDGSWRGWPAS